MSHLELCLAVELEESDVVVEGLAVVVVVDVGRCNPKHNISSCTLLYVSVGTKSMAKMKKLTYF